MDLETQARTIVGEKLLSLIDTYPNKPWDWTAISQNPNITLSIIDKYPTKP